MLLYMGSGSALAAYHRNRRIRALNDCARACDEAARHCLERLVPSTPEREGPARVRALALDCREFCTLTATLMTRTSTLGPCTYPACAEACRLCAEACEVGVDDEVLSRCALICRQCEEACRNLARNHEGIRA